MGLLDGKVSQDDIQRVQDIRHHPQYESGFDSNESLFEDSFGGEQGLDMNDLFGGDDVFGGGGSESFEAQGSNPFGGAPQQSSNAFGMQGGSVFGASPQSNAFGAGGFGTPGGIQGAFGTPGGLQGAFSPFGNQNAQQAQQMEQQPDTLDKLMDTGADAAKSIGAILMEMVKSFKLRNADDFGYLSRNLIISGGAMIPLGILMGIIGIILHSRMLSFSGMGAQSMLAGALAAATGITGMGTAALILTKNGESEVAGVDNLPDVPDDGDDNATNDYEDNLDSILDDLLDIDFDTDNDGDDLNKAEPEEIVEEFIPDMKDLDSEKIDFTKELENIGSNKYITRETLFNTFKPMLPTCTPKFSYKKEIDVDSTDFKTLETICLKALANLANCQLEELNSSLESANETFFSYELRLKRINKVKKTDDLAREMEVYMRSDSNDDSVNATVGIEGDFYKIVVTKGVSAIITFGDVFKLDYTCEFFLDNKNKLPMVTGIDELGRVIIDDAKNFDTMLIAGKPRSGKSWYVLSILMSLMLFNSPEDVQFVIVDPKESNLFKTMSLMPHVCGLHNDEHILQILDDIIEVEAPRRKKLLSDNRCDDIWALRKKGINLPVLYLVIDEYITVINNLDKDEAKDFDAKIQTLISQLPSQGIRLLFVPHRATGIVNKTNRTMLQYTAAVRADKADVEDTLGITKWDRALTKPGDIAVKNSMMKTAQYVRGAALTTDDGDNAIFIETAAKAFYKMGVDIPDMSNMRYACNRDEEYIQQELGGTAKRVQYDASSILNDIENEDFSSL